MARMTAPVLVPSLKQIQAELDEVAPNRQKPDGWIGDDEHKQHTSDHNVDDGPEQGSTTDEDSDSKPEVHATDISKNLNSPNLTMQQFVDYMVSECRKSGESGKDKGRLKLIIFNRYKYQAPEWKKVTYTGSNPHTEHCHISAEYDSQYSEDRSPYGIVDKFGGIVSGTVDSFSQTAVDQLVAAATKGVLSYGDAAGGEEGGVPDLPGQEASNVLNIIADLYAQVTALTAAVANLTELVQAGQAPTEDR